MSGVTVRPGGLDLPWRDSYAVLLVGPIDLPSPARLVDALTRLRGFGPAARVGLTAVEGGRRLVWEPGARDDDVQVRRREPADDDEALARANAWISELGPGAPDRVRLLVVGRWLAACFPHVLGDARFMMNVLTSIVTMAHGSGPPVWAGGPGTAHPLRSAIGEQFGLRPSAWWRAARSVRPERAARGTAAPQPEFTASRMSVHARSDPRATAALREWRRTHAPGTSTVAVQFAVAYRALAHVGLTPAGPEHVLVDLRRYLPAGQQVTGNFVVGLDLRPDDPGDPAAVAAAIDDATDSGRPLTAALARAALARLPRRGRPVATPPAGVPPRLALTHVGRPLAIGRLPWAMGPERRTFAGALDPPGPSGLTIGMAEVGPVLQVTASFHRTVLPVDRVREALRLLAHEPVALLVDRQPAGSGRR